MSEEYSRPPLRDFPPDRLEARKSHLLAEIAREQRSYSTIARFGLTRPRVAVLASLSLCIAATSTVLVLVTDRGPSSGRVPTIGLHSSRHPTDMNRTASATDDCQPIKVFQQPPAGFDPRTATAAQLEEYGFPPRPPGDPTDPTVQAALQAWLNAMAASKTAVPPNPICGTTTHPPGHHAR